MEPRIKFRLVLMVVGFLLFTPIGRCAPPNAPSHPCCPKGPSPVPQDCGRPGCVYVEAAQIASTLEGPAHSLHISTELMVGVAIGYACKVEVSDVTAPPNRRLFLVERQLLI
jgi:hypothetical protein